MNKKRLIYADELLSGGFITENVRFKRGRFCIPWGDIKRSVKNAPTVDAVEVVHAKWGYHRGKLCCRNCGFEPSYSLYSRDGFSNSNYCPNCGAKMDGE